MLRPLGESTHLVQRVLQLNSTMFFWISGGSGHWTSGRLGSVKLDAQTGLFVHFDGWILDQENRKNSNGNPSKTMCAPLNRVHRRAKLSGNLKGFDGRSAGTVWPRLLELFCRLTMHCNKDSKNLLLKQRQCQLLCELRGPNHQGSAPILQTLWSCGAWFRRVQRWTKRRLPLFR